MDAVKIEKDVTAHYRRIFDTFFDNRYDIVDECQPIEVHAFFVDFVQALGFSPFYEGPRFLQITDSVYNNVQRTMSYMLNLHKLFKYRRFTKLEEKVITMCASSAFLFTIGYHDVESYIKKEKEALHFFGVSLDRVRMYAKDIFSRLLVRFDQFICGEPMDPIKWSIIERRMGYVTTKFSTTRGVAPWLGRKGATSPTGVHQQITARTAGRSPQSIGQQSLPPKGDGNDTETVVRREHSLAL